MPVLPEIFRLPFFTSLAEFWINLPKVLDEAILDGRFVGHEQRAGWVPLKGLSPISDLFQPKAYGAPGFARVYNRQIRKFRRREAISAYVAKISKQELEARLETYARLAEGFERNESALVAAEAKPPDPN